MRIGIVTRGDVFPTVHGAAVKIVRTAEGLGRLAPPCVLITDRKDVYWRFAGDRIEEAPFPAWTRRIRDHRAVRERLLEWIGVPPADRLLFVPLLDLNFLARIVSIVRQERLTLLQAEFPFYAVPMLVARALTGVRTSIMQHNIEHLRMAGSSGLDGRAQRRVRRIESFLCRNVQDVIALSEVDRDHLVGMGVDPARITIIPHGVDLGNYEGSVRLDARAKHGIAHDEPLLVFHGTLHYAPNTAAVRILAREILPRLERRGRKVRALVCGMGPPREYASEGLTFTDVVDDLPSHLRAADLAVVPLLDGGGTRMKILEYMAARLPIVSTRKGAEGLPVEHGRELMLADDHDWDGFVDHVDYLLEQPTERKRLGHAGRAYVQSLDWIEIARAYVRAYQVPRGPIERLRASYRRAARKVLTEPASGLAESLARAHQRAENERDKDAYFAYLDGQAPAPAPKILLFLLNKNCNLKCVFCDLWPHHDMMPHEQVRNVLEQAAEIGTRHAVLTGGEPFVLPHLFDVIRYAKDLRLGVNVTTNGTLIEKRFDELLDAPLDSLSVSIDALDDSHDELRGKISLDKILAGLEKLRRASPMKISIYHVVTNKNLHQLERTYEFAHSIGAEFGFWPVNGYEFLHVREPEQVRSYLATIDRLAVRDAEVRVRREYYQRAMAYHSASQLSVRCLGLVQKFGVDVHGNVLPCCVWGNQGLTVGNVFETPLRELWHAERTHSLRRRIFDQGCKGLCYNHALYEFQEVTGHDFLVSESGTHAEPAPPPVPGRDEPSHRVLVTR